MTKRNLFLTARIFKNWPLIGIVNIYRGFGIWISQRQIIRIMNVRGKLMTLFTSGRKS